MIKKFFVILIAIVVATMAISSDALGQGIIRNSSSKALVAKDRRLNKDLQIRIGMTAQISADPGTDVYVPIIFLGNQKKMDTVIVGMKFKTKGDIFEIKDYHLTGTTPTASANLKSAPTADPTKKPNSKITIGPGKFIVNNTLGKITIESNKVALAPGDTSNSRWVLSSNEHIAYEKNNRQFFLEINGLYGSSDFYVINEASIPGTNGDDSTRTEIAANDFPYLFIDDQNMKVKGIKPMKGRKAFTKNLPDGANTIMYAALGEDGTSLLRYFATMASKTKKVIYPDQNSLSKPTVIVGEKRYLPVAGFDKNSTVELFDQDKKQIFKVVVDANDTSIAQSCYSGLGWFKVSYFEEIMIEEQVKKILRSFEFFMIIAEGDEFIKINPDYFWDLEGDPVEIRFKNLTSVDEYQELEVWPIIGNVNEAKRKKIVVIDPYPSEKILVREGIPRIPVRYKGGQYFDNATLTILISFMDKKKNISIFDGNIHRID